VTIFPGDKLLIMTGDLWFPGGIMHTVTFIKGSGSYLQVEGEKRRLGFLWKVRKRLWIPPWEVCAVISSKSQESEITELNRMMNL